MGVVGIGQIGSVVADRAQGLKMHVLAYDPFLSPEAAEKLGVTVVSFDELIRSADFITVHTPLMKETRGIINAAAFEKMKKGVFIINCARGGIVNEKDLLDALVSGKVAGAALDVFEEEPTKNMDLVCHPNVICTPHLGASTDEAQVNVAIAVAEQMAAYLTTGGISNAVNFPSVSAELLNVIEPYIDLAEKLGKFHAQLAQGAIQEVKIEYSGKILGYNVAPITIALLKGLLTPSLGENVNYINAPILAKERGIGVSEAKSSEMKDYTSLISLTIKTPQKSTTTEGALFGLKDPRIVRINQFVLDVAPEGYMLVIYNEDRPGVIGNIGTTLGADGVNIARLHLSREQVDEQALVILSTDSPVSGDVISKLRSLPHVISVTDLEM
jgi:D-3-phosphoglycerate dehydrogenase